MKKQVCVAVCAIALLPAAAAEARPTQDPCACQRRFALNFQKDDRAQYKFGVTAAAQGVSRRRRKAIKEQIGAYAATGQTAWEWCKNHPKLCGAVIACLGAAGTTMTISLANGDSEKRATRNAAVACAGAAATALATP